MESRQGGKRILGTILQIGLAGLGLASNLVVLTNALTEGCAPSAYPEICDYRDEIEILLNQTNINGAVLADQNYENQVRYAKMRKAMTNNKYIKYYTDEDTKAVRSLESLLNDTEHELLNYQRLETFADYVTADDIIDYVFSPIEWTIGNIDQMISNAQSAGYITVAANMGANLAMLAADKLIAPWIARSYKAAVSNIKVQTAFVELAGIYEAFEDVTDATNAARNMGRIRTGLRNFKTKFSTKFPRLSGTLEEMSKRVGKVFTVKNWKISPRKIGNNLIKKFTDSAKKSFTLIRSRYTMIRNKNYGGFFQSYKIFQEWPLQSGWARFKSVGPVVAKAMGAVLSAATDVLSIVMDNIQWREVRDNLREAKITYQQRKIAVDEELVKAVNYSHNLDTDFVNVATSFQSFVEDGFKYMLNTTTEIYTVIQSGNYENLSGIDPDSELFQEGFYDDVTEANIEYKQDITLQILEPIKDGFFETEELFRSMKIYAEDVIQYVNASKSLNYIKDVLKGSFRGSRSDAAKAFGSSLSERDVLCPIAMSALPGESDYKGYSLQPFRTTRCHVSDADWQQISANAEQMRFDENVKNTLNVSVEHGQTIAFMLDQVLNEYENQDPIDEALLDKARNLTKKDILCYVANMLPNDAYYDNYELSIFRVDDCKTITAAQFEEADEARDARAKLAQDVSQLVFFCKNNYGCPCFLINDITVEDFTALASGDPDFPEYCFTETCDDAPPCIDLS